MDILIIVLLTAGIFVLALWVSKAYSLFRVWNKARKFGLRPDLPETLALNQFYELEENFLKACQQFKALDPSISIKNIVRHHMADGDTWALLDKMKQLKQDDLALSFESAILYDLSGKDLVEIAQKQNRVFEINLNETSEGNIRFFYSCQFKISPESTAWIEPDIKNYTWQISHRIKKALDQGNHEAPDALVSYVLEKYLHASFWKTLCHGVVLNQTLKILTK